jgi:hypothetical protein
MEDRPQAAVYQLYDKDGRTLYVGSSIRPTQRLVQHSKKPWWPQVDPSRTVITWYADDFAAAIVEYQTALRDKPLHTKPHPRNGTLLLDRLIAEGHDLTPIPAPVVSTAA